MYKEIKNYFIPHQGNNHKPHSLRSKSAKILLGITLIAEIIIMVLVLPIFPAKLDYLAAVLPSVLIQSTNQTRLEKSLGSLKESPVLTTAAQLKADDMANKGYFAHITPDGKQPWFFFDTVGYSYRSAGENLAVNFIDSEDVHDAWMNSDTHRANILQGKFTEIGIATSRGRYQGKEVIFVVEFFGTPSVSAQIVPTPPTITQINRPVTTENVLALKPETKIDSKMTVEEKVLGEETEVLAITDVDLDDTNNDKEQLGLLEEIASTPKNTATNILWGLFYFIISALLLAFSINIKVQHKNILAKGILMTIIILTFLYINTQVIASVGMI